MHLSITSRPFWTFLKIRGDIRGSRCTTGVNHRWQMEKIFKQKNFNNFVWAPLGSRVNIYINFCLQKHFKVSAAWYCSHYLPPVSMTAVANLPPVSMILVAICHRRRWHRRQFCHRCRWHQWCTLTGEYLREFSKKFEMTLMFFSRAWGRVIHEKKLKQKISWHCPFKCVKIAFFEFSLF